MDARLRESLTGRERNHVLPFLWMRQGHRKELPSLVQQVYDGGARAFCVESRPHNAFCEEEWWGDMDVILAQAQKRDMKVWILDDKHFPTGYANGLIRKKYPNLRKWHLVEEHVDVIGPARENAILLAGFDQTLSDDTSAGCSGQSEATLPDDALLGVYAYRRDSVEEVLFGEPIDLTDRVKGRYVYWDIPEGIYRVFALYRTRRGASNADYIHMIDPESVHALIEAVYEPHYEHYREYFGNTLAGFFSDEPSFGNGSLIGGGETPSMYNNRLGQPGLALPWTDEVLSRMNDARGRNVLPYLPTLWFSHENGASEVRVAYMDAVTRLWESAFSEQVGTWCREHGVEYIGHIIEDMNAHARLHCSGGHYFRSLSGQDMAGIDVVLHQIIPGMAHAVHAASCAGGMADPRFFDYVLARLAASLSHIVPRMKHRAMCEVFGAYGWAEGVPMMKHLMDHMLVRGINCFVPHAFSPDFPDNDCPPHFNAGGRNPEFSAFARLMRYTNQASHLLSDGVEIVQTAILYHAEAEWSGEEYMLTETVAMPLYDAQYNYDILPIDAIVESTVENGQLRIGEMTYPSLIVPYARTLPKRFLDRCDALLDAGFPIAFVRARPEGFDRGEVIAREDAAEFAARHCANDCVAETPFELLRKMHIRRNGADIFMLVNEDMTRDFAGNVRFSASGKCVCSDLSRDNSYADTVRDGALSVQLQRGQSLFVVFGSDMEASDRVVKPIRKEKIRGTWTLARKRFDADAFEKAVPLEALYNVTGLHGDPDFSGMMRYETVFTAKAGACGIDLGLVGECAAVEINGKDMGLLIDAPYTVYGDAVIREGENHMTVTVSNSMVHAVKDFFSKYEQIPPSGLLGDVCVLYRE